MPNQNSPDQTVLRSLSTTIQNADICRGVIVQHYFVAVAVGDVVGNAVEDDGHEDCYYHHHYHYDHTSYCAIVSEGICHNQARKRCK